MAMFESSSSLESSDALYKKATIRKNSQVMQVVVFSTAAVTKIQGIVWQNSSFATSS